MIILTHKKGESVQSIIDENRKYQDSLSRQREYYVDKLSKSSESSRIIMDSLRKSDIRYDSLISASNKQKRWYTKEILRLKTSTVKELEDEAESIYNLRPDSIQ